MKKTEEIMEILAAYDLTQSFRDAAELAGCDHHTEVTSGASNVSPDSESGDCCRASHQQFTTVCQALHRQTFPRRIRFAALTFRASAIA